jgi:hypothetical protein
MNGSNKNMLFPYVNIVKEKNKIWTILVNQNVIVEGDLETGKCHILDFFSLDPSNNSYGNWYLHKKDDLLYINFSVKRDIYIYNLKTHKWKSICVNEPDKEIERTDIWFMTDFIYRNAYWKIGSAYPGIIKFDHKDEQITYLDQWRHAVDELIKSYKGELYFGTGHAFRGDRVLLPLDAFAAVLELDMITLQYELHVFPEQCLGFRVLSGDDDELWIETMDGSILCVDGDWNVTSINIPKSFSLAEQKVKKYWPPVIFDDFVLLFPSVAGKIFRIDRKSYEVSSFHLLNEKLLKSSEENLFTTDICRENNHLLFFYRGNEGNAGYCEYDAMENSVYMGTMYFEDDDEVVVNAMRNAGNVIYEDTLNSMDMYIKSIIMGKGKML